MAGVAAIGLALWLEPEGASTPDAGAIPFAQVAPIFEQRCATCHSGASAPLGVRLDTEQQITARAEDIERQAVLTRAMPPGNATGMTDAERELLGAWIAQR